MRTSFRLVKTNRNKGGFGFVGSEDQEVIIDARQGGQVIIFHTPDGPVTIYESEHAKWRQFINNEPLGTVETFYGEV